MTSSEGGDVEFVVRVDAVGLRRLYENVRSVLLERGCHLVDAVAVLRVLERLVAVSIDRDAKRLRVCVRVTATCTRVEVIDRRRPNSRTGLPSGVVVSEVARRSGADLVAAGGGVMLWAIVDRVLSTDEPRTA